ncbi:hypothetical protein EBL89_03660 [Cereibacter sphaeroides]|uniref:hypothetical protein n=1 Tax=Cereibacter sphaeroides TaxID=1063 RepID=UPI000F536DAF|nr:hypothetical protein [Cereibacter sphaeroides]AZB54462.1 hypothetical protein EBL89_03660 [Cereibacter sphaeroides]AZB58736.1 hypothetical protein EBL88_03750 [Cereibacter sphaeroides]
MTSSTATTDFELYGTITASISDALKRGVSREAAMETLITCAGIVQLDIAWRQHRAAPAEG